MCIIYISICEVIFVLTSVMKAYGGVKEWLHAFLDVSLVGRE